MKHAEYTVNDKRVSRKRFYVEKKKTKKYSSAIKVFKYKNYEFHALYIFKSLLNDKKFS